MKLILPLVLIFVGCSGKIRNQQAKEEIVGRQCGELIKAQTHNGSTTQYSLSLADGDRKKTTIIMMIGGDGRLKFNSGGCPTELYRNPLNRLRPLLVERGMNVALVDAPSNYYDDDGLAGFRAQLKHAEDIKLIADDIRRRTNSDVWIAGHSRGSISAANAAARIKNIGTLDGVILMSAMFTGEHSQKRPYVSQTVFDIQLNEINMPALILAHANDECARSPANRAQRALDLISSKRKQLVIFKRSPHSASGDKCGAVSPHGFWGQDAEIADGILGFVGGADFAAHGSK